MTANQGGPVHGPRPTLLESGEKIVAVVDELDAPPKGVTLWAAVRHQARLRGRVQRIAQLAALQRQMHADAIRLVTAENRKWMRRALEAEGFIALSGLERTYGLRDTSSRPRQAAPGTDSTAPAP